MKKITFSRCSRNGRYFTYQFNGVYQDRPTYLDELTQGSIVFNMLLMSNKFKAQIGNTNIIGYTDRYGNKIIRYV